MKNAGKPKITANGMIATKNVTNPSTTFRFISLLFALAGTVLLSENYRISDRFCVVRKFQIVQCKGDL